VARRFASPVNLAKPGRAGQNLPMRHCCEVCGSFRPGAHFGGNYRVIEVQLDVRNVHLCIGHARIAENSGVATFDELRELYGEGRRSFVPRRDPCVEPSEGRARTSGRRKTDLPAFTTP
jgi:hypothetical protein